MRLRSSKQEPYSYRPAYIKDIDTAKDPNCVNTPALRTGFTNPFGPTPEDKQLGRLVEQFRAGKITCRKAIVGMFWIRPHTDYHPQISPKFRDYIEMMGMFGDNYNKGPISIILYEHKGQLIMSADYKTYWLHRIDEAATVHALVLGDFTERYHCRSLGDPFKIDSLNLDIKDELMDSDTRRLALLLRGEQIRIETKEEREAINKKDFHDAIKEPVPYEPEWASTMNPRGEDPHLVLTPAQQTGHFFGPIPTDERYAQLASQAQAGELDCQFANITMAMIRPHSDYHASISGELREEFEARYDTPDQLQVTAYEYEPGHFMVSGNDDNYAIYTLYREKQPISALCNIMGPHTKTWAVDAIGKPFRVKWSSQSGYDPKKTGRHIGRRMYKIMLEQKLDLVQLARLTGIDYPELGEIINKWDAKAPTIDQLERITRALGASASDIIPF